MNSSIYRMSVLSLLALIIPDSLATAQQAGGQPADMRYGTGVDSGYNYRGSIGGGYGYGVYGRGFGRASTAAEGMARGMSDVIRSRGQAAVDYARAATESERTRRLYLENRNFAISSFVQNRAIRDEYRERINSEKREKLAAYVQSKQFQPLTRSEFYETTGEVNWPIALLHPHDEKGRQEIDALFRERAMKGSLAPEEYIRLNKLLSIWANHVSTHNNDFTGSQIREGVRFLRRLEMLLKGDFE